jgi:predicted RND superfamily exporter protein
VRAAVLKAGLSDVPSDALAALKQFDGIVPGAGFADADLRIADALDLKVLAEVPSPNLESGVNGGGVDIVYTGVMPIVYKAQRALLDSLIQSTWWSFATITPLMMIVCRSLLGGAVVMLPNVLPVLMVFGGMGWLNIDVDIGSMMAASIALGVAVDDTIHFLAWFRDDLHTLGDREAAVMSAYGRSATPTLQAALINGLGLFVFATSSFTPTQRFGWLMLVILAGGVIAELVMLPALLFSPVGRVFAHSNGGGPASETNSPHKPAVSDGAAADPAPV